jgi:cytochrome P450
MLMDDLPADVDATEDAPPAAEAAGVANTTPGMCPVRYFDFDGGVWLLGTYDTLTYAARHPELFSSEHDVDGTRRQYERDGERRPYLGAGVPSFPVRLGLIDMDPPEHRPYRKLLTPLLSPAEVARKEPRIRELVTECIDAFIESGRFDVMDDLATPIPALITMESLGLSSTQARRYANVMHAVSVDVPGPARDEANERMGEMLAEIAVIVRQRREHPQDDWLSCLATAEIDGAPMSDTVLLENALVLIAGGVETATTLVATTLLHLQRNPGDRERLMADRALIPAACEELLRFYTPIRMQGRTVTGPTTIGGVDLVEGDRVALCFAEANRDPEVFDAPGKIRLDRSNNRHVAFGAGVHRCVGAHLGQLEFKVILEAVLDRLPDYGIDESAIVVREIPAIHSYLAMPATFTPGVRLGSAAIASE